MMRLQCSRLTAFVSNVVHFRVAIMQCQRINITPVRSFCSSKDEIENKNMEEEEKQGHEGTVTGKDLLSNLHVKPKTQNTSTSGLSSLPDFMHNKDIVSVGSQENINVDDMTGAAGVGDDDIRGFSPPQERYSGGKGNNSFEVLDMVKQGSKPVWMMKEDEFLPKSPYAHLHIAIIDATFNNTKLSITLPDGPILFGGTCGTVGFKNSKKKSAHAAQVVGQVVGEKMRLGGVHEVRVKLKGIGQGRLAAVKGLQNAGVRIQYIEDATPIPHNGCRPKKPRRL